MKQKKNVMETNRILLKYEEQLHKEAIAKKEKAENAFLDLINYTQNATNIKIEDIEAFEANPIDETTRLFWESFKDGFSAPIDSRKALSLTSYEIPVAQGLYAKYLQLKKEVQPIDKARFCTYVAKDKEEFYTDAKRLEDTIKEIRTKYPHYNIKSMYLIRAFDFLRWEGLNFTLKENSFV
jgi:hypothetical protein